MPLECPLNHYASPYKDIHSLYYHAWWAHSLVWFNCVLITVILWTGNYLLWPSTEGQLMHHQQAVGNMMLYTIIFLYTITTAVSQIINQSVDKLIVLFLICTLTLRFPRCHICWFSLSHVTVVLVWQNQTFDDTTLGLWHMWRAWLNKGDNNDYYHFVSVCM